MDAEKGKANHRIHMVISDGNSKTYYYRKMLYQEGFRFIRTDGKWHRDTTNEYYVQYYRKFAKNLNLVFISYDDSRVRAKNYREVFFENNSPIIGQYYVCAYCFKLLKKQDVSVDHIISVNKSQKNKLANWLMNRMDIKNVNDEKNLCCSCKECNSAKGKKAGLWVIRGFLGKKKGFIWTVYIGSIAVIIFLIGMMIQVLGK